MLNLLLVMDTERWFVTQVFGISQAKWAGFLDWFHVPLETGLISVLNLVLTPVAAVIATRVETEMLW